MATNDLAEAEVFGPVGYIALCLAHLRAGYPISELDDGPVMYVAPTQADVDNARRMADILAVLARREQP
ncbi:hypothetical protein ACWELV_21690 [Streptomyces mirabilis]